jgi:hypothetical protein
MQVQKLIRRLDERENLDDLRRANMLRGLRHALGIREA